MSEKSEIKDDGDRDILIACTHKKKLKINLAECMFANLSQYNFNPFFKSQKKTNNENF